MASIVIGRPLPFEAVFKESVFILTGIEPDYEYQNNQRTDRLAGYKYEVVDTVDFDKIKVKIRGQEEPLMPPEKLAQLRENGEKVAVEFIDGFDKLYIRRNGNTSSIEDSFSAGDIRLVEHD